MAKTIQRILLYTSGGDCAGMNAVIHGAAVTAKVRGVQLYGVTNAGAGLTVSPPDVYDLLSSQTAPYADLSGTILGSNTSGKPLTSEERETIRQNVKNLGIDAIAVVGGEGSIKYLSGLFDSLNISLPIVLVPKTIDNDVPYVDQCLGFDSAVQHNADLIRTCYLNANSMGFIHIVEIMGRTCGDLAFHSAARSGHADIVLIPERPYKMQSIMDALKVRWESGQSYATIVISEGIKGLSGEELIAGYKEDKTPIMGFALGRDHDNNLIVGTAKDYIKAQLIMALSKYRPGEFFDPNRIRLQSPGHSQRGADVSYRDRMLGEKLGKEVVNALLDGKDRIVLTYWGETNDLRLTGRPIYDITQGIHQSYVPPEVLLDTGNSGVSLGCEPLKVLRESFSNGRRSQHNHQPIRNFTRVGMPKRPKKTHSVSAPSSCTDG